MIVIIWSLLKPWKPNSGLLIDDFSIRSNRSSLIGCTGAGKLSSSKSD